MTIQKSRLFSLLVVSGLGSLLPSGRAADPAGPDPDAPYQARKVRPVTYDVDYSVVVTAPYATRVLKVWLPLPQTEVGQEVQGSEITTFPMPVKPRIASETRFGNRFAYFEFRQPQGAQIIRHRFKIKVWELHWDVEPARVVKVKQWPRSFDRYLHGETQAVVVTDQLRGLVRDVVPRRRGPSEDMALVMDWVNRHVTYDHGAASLQASSEHALRQGRGHCSDYHSLCAAFGRSLGYPTRITYGINLFPKNSPSHCKLEVYLPPYGWVSFDVSETQKLLQTLESEPKLSEKQKQELIQWATRRLARGFRDNTWFVQTKGSDYDLAPPASKRVPVVRTIHAEADGVPLPEPDPADPRKREFSWMTAHQYVPDRETPYPFKERRTLSER